MLDEEQLAEAWKELSIEEASETARRHLHGFVRAAHEYVEKHGTLPPAVVPNADLPPEKRLSGLVLLLPHLDAKSWLESGEPCFDEATVAAGRRLYDAIDLKKAWDDPVNLKAARTIFPPFLAPQGGSFRDENGYAVSHFAFVRGANGKDDGAFGGQLGVKIGEITDGTVVTLAMGQIFHELGPWIAAGPSTARHAYHPSDDFTAPTFGSPHEGGAFFAMCDSTSSFLVVDKVTRQDYHALATRAGGELISAEGIHWRKTPLD